ncbi:hypothetical protein Bca52824_040488 [Brassica carinata]|uniref:Uncharacterized protein n=1 Tax=Brassica carinata TaxID=52824 RepID=A0A8X7UWZ1_BRACI|nr:hypothetical protein Bca52824_040488 [Brassica carinata]
MANARVFLSDLKFCRCFSTVEARNIRRGDELMSVDMLLLDSNVTTKSFITGELTSVKRHSYFYNFFTNDTGNTSAVSLLRGFSKVEPMKIAELNQFIITAQHQPIKFICTGKVTVSSQKKDGATSWTLEITCVGSVSLSAKMFGGGNEKENNSGSKTSTGLILKKSSDHNIC